jgi:predicted HicB family RNase H-like nuclease
MTKGKFTDMLNAAQQEKAKEQPPATEENDPIVNLNLKVPKSIRKELTIAARQLNMSNKDLVIKAVAEYIERHKPQ